MAAQSARSSEAGPAPVQTHSSKPLPRFSALSTRAHRDTPRAADGGHFTATIPSRTHTRTGWEVKLRGFVGLTAGLFRHISERRGPNPLFPTLLASCWAEVPRPCPPAAHGQRGDWTLRISVGVSRHSSSRAEERAPAPPPPFPGQLPSSTQPPGGELPSRRVPRGEVTGGRQSPLEGERLRDRAEERGLGPAWGSLPGLPGQTRGQASGTRCDHELSEQEEGDWGKVPVARARCSGSRPEGGVWAGKLRAGESRAPGFHFCAAQPAPGPPSRILVTQGHCPLSLVAGV